MKRRWQDHIIFVIGVWLIASPWALGAYGPDSFPLGLPAWNFFLCGLVVAALGGAAYSSYHVWEDRIDILVGCWLVISPWALRFAEDAFFSWNALLSGFLLILLAGWVLARKRSFNASERGR